MKFGLLYLTDYHPDVHETYTTYYEQLLEQIVTAEALGLDGAWCAEPRIPRFALSSSAYASVGSPDGGAESGSGLVALI